MHNFCGSSNSRYLLAEKSRTITLYEEGRINWSTELPEGEFEIIGIGNNGCVAILLNREIYIFRPGGRAVGELLKRFSPELLEKTSSTLDNLFMLDRKGAALAYCRITNKSSFSEKVHAALASKQAEKDLSEFEIEIYDLASKNTRNIYKIVHPLAVEGSFRWSISKDFSFLVVGNPMRKGSSGVQHKYSIIEVNTQRTVRSFELQDIKTNRMLINDKGMILIDAFQRDIHFILIVSQGRDILNISPPHGAEILHFGRSYVAFYIQDPPMLLAKSFHDKCLRRFSFDELEEVGLEYGLLFNEDDSINLLYFEDNCVSTVQADLNRFLTEVNRSGLSTEVTGIKIKEY